MAETIPAMRGRLGTTDYYIVTMKAKRVAEKMQSASEVDGWENLSLDEKYQRKINLNRVKKEIAPYFATMKDRFTGSLIVAMQNSEGTEYEPVKEVIKGTAFQGAHKSAADNLGFLTFTDEEVFVPIDGQHRAKALQYAISGKDERNDDLPFHPDSSLAQEDIVVVLVKFNTDEEKIKARKIFNKVNRYAKQPTKAENLIVDDDDVVAILTRRMTKEEEDLLSGSLIEFSGNTLPANSNAFTTLTTLYEINHEILSAKGHDFSKTERPSPEIEKIFWDEIQSTWKFLIENFGHFQAALKDVSEDGRDTRKQLRESFLTMKPIGQRVLVRAFLQLTETQIDGASPEMNKEEAIEKLDKIDWKIENKIWRNILTRDERRVLSGTAAISLGADFVCYLAGASSNLINEEELIDRISVDGSNYSLPSRD